MRLEVAERRSAYTVTERMPLVYGMIPNEEYHALAR